MGSCTSVPVATHSVSAGLQKQHEQGCNNSNHQAVAVLERAVPAISHGDNHQADLNVINQGEHGPDVQASSALLYTLPVGSDELGDERNDMLILGTPGKGCSDLSSVAPAGPNPSWTRSIMLDWQLALQNAASR